MPVSQYAGKTLPAELLTDIPKLLAAYYKEVPDPAVAEQKISFGTSGHRGSSLLRTFNERHILAVTQAICQHRKAAGIDGPLFIGMDTHALSVPALETALEVLAANSVHVMIDSENGYTPTPALSRAILAYNANRTTGLADGILITPSHNPPADGGFKYNPPSGGPAGPEITGTVQNIANEILSNGLAGVKRMQLASALKAATTRRYDYTGEYVRGLAGVINMEAVRGSGVKMGADPLGGAGVKYWGRIAEVYGLDLAVVSDAVDKSFAFMTADWDGKIRMDPSSVYAMQRLIGMKDKFDISFGCDTDYDRHGIVTRAGLLPPNHYLSAAIYYLFRNRPGWRADAAVGKTVVSSSMIDRVAAGLGRKLNEVPVGFKWFVDGLRDGSCGFGGEESAGASFLRFDGGPWSTDKDGLIMALLSAEITAVMGKDPARVYGDLTKKYGEFFYRRQDAPADAAMKLLLKTLKPEQVKAAQLAGEKIEAVLNCAPSNGEPIGGIKVVTAGGWFAARPSGTEEVYKIYAESCRSEEHLAGIFAEAEALISSVAARAAGKL
ncbi:MAG: alpha-D-glucose phosphate-specific phosphoglucomutase [Elusimicrobia bacterium CG_4_10_14_0_2_um_filter_56_8]|nr:MAG: phosphoglucomutase, alpha-D-glucose phosphate-specific [Elusimicrobia bacterium CG1_02_56_21]PJA15110.1 MAG: alpha-D-glucose phosphate-specific phosphoglucomutase [Elusimicrobia bacterium CG_4_10_14_0_2_um_filter_56_8]